MPHETLCARQSGGRALILGTGSHLAYLGLCFTIECKRRGSSYEIFPVSAPLSSSVGSFSLSTVPLVDSCAGYTIREVNERTSLIDWNIASEGKNQHVQSK